jgi:mono/diheme cytochrome c family protein
VNRSLALSQLFAALAALLLLAGCSKSGDSGATSASATPAPAAAGGVLDKSQYDDGPRAGEQPIQADQVADGEALFKSKGCSACHTFGKRMSGPDLNGVTMRRTAAWMEHQILHPEVMTKQDPISHGLMAVYALQMPNQGLTPEQAEHVIEFLKSHNKAGK